MDKTIATVTAIALTLTLAACSGPSHKLSKSEERALRQGNYSLIIVQPDSGAEPVAVLDREDDPYTITPSGGTETSRTSGLSRKEAIRRADESLPGSGVTMKAVIGTDDAVLGYEVYPPPSYAPADTAGEAELMPNILSIGVGSDSKGDRRIMLKILPINPDRERAK